MSEWKEFKFSEFVDINPNVVLPKSELISFVEMKDISDGTRFCYPSAERPKGSGSRFQNGDTLFARITPCLENGKIAQVSGLKNGVGIGSTEFLVFRGKENVSDNNFVYYLSRWNEVRAHAELNLDGTSGRQRVPKECFNELSLLLPTSINEQSAIASILSSLDDKIDLLHRQNETLEKMAETLFRQWFVEEAKEEWEHGSLGDFVTISYGKNLPTSKLLEKGYPVFGGNGIIGYYNHYTYKDPQVLVSCRGEASGTINISLKESFITNNSLVLEIGKRPEITFEFLKYNSLNTDLKVFVSGSAQPQITIEGLYHADFVLPPKDLVQKFTNQVRNIEIKRTNNLDQILTLAKLRDTILPRLLKAELSIKP